MRGKVDVIIDSSYGSSGKGKVSTWLADNLCYDAVTSANYPNAGHTAIVEGFKFVAKAIPTAAVLNRSRDYDGIPYYLTPGSGFTWEQLIKEWQACSMPLIRIHERACVLTDEHASRERAGADSTAHIASTMQGTAAAMCDKIMRRKNAPLARNYSVSDIASNSFHANTALEEEFENTVEIVSAVDFRDRIHDQLVEGNVLHEGSQGYALSIDHGSHYPHCTSRNCTTAAALDYLGVAPQRLGDVWLNLRTYPIRVGSIPEGSSGDFYSDSKEITWAEVAALAGMPAEEAIALAERERTTVTKRVRRVSTFSFDNLRDAVRTNGATKLSLNFVQYLSWSDNGKRRFEDLSYASRTFIDSVENAVDLPVVLVGTGAAHEDMIVRSEFL